VTTAATEWRIGYTTGGTAQPINLANVLAGRDLHVRTAIAFDRAVYYNDEPIVVKASAHAGGRPISGARITVEVEGPALSEGELFVSNSDLAIPPKSRRRTRESADGPHPGSREAFLGRILAAKKLKTFPTVQYKSVFVDGTNELRADRYAGDGYYSNAFTKNWREGTYHFKFTISGKTPEGGEFSDVHAQSRLVKLRADNASSKIAVVEVPKGHTRGLRSVRVKVTPRDALGQHLGPFHAADVKFHTTRGEFVDGMESELDGSYSQILAYPEKEVPVVTAEVQGRMFTSVDLSQQPPSRTPDGFDLDVRFGDPGFGFPEDGFGFWTAVDCPGGTKFCPGSDFCPGTDHACYGATGRDTQAGLTCKEYCGKTRVNTCVECLVTVKVPPCKPVITVRKAVTCLNTCVNNTCICPPATGTCACG